MPFARSAFSCVLLIPSAEAAALISCWVYAPMVAPAAGAGILPRFPARAHGGWLASLCLMASAWVWVRSLFLTSSASVSPIAFWTAAFTWLWLLPRSLDRWETKSLQMADALAFWLIRAASAEAGCDEEGRKPTFKPAAEAVTRTAAPATRTAPTANPRTLRWRSLARLAFTSRVAQPHRHAFITLNVKVL